MRLNYQFSNLLGCAYRGGNILFTSDGTSLLSPVGNRVTVFDLLNHTSQTLRFQQRHNIKCLSLSPDNKLLISIDIEGNAAIMNFRKQIVLATMKFKSQNINAIAFSPDSKYLAVAHDNTISVWKSPSLIVEWKPMLLHSKYRGHYNDILCISWSKDSQFFVSGSKDMTAKIHSLHKRKPFKSQSLTGHKGHVIAAFFGDDYKLYTITRNGFIYQWIAGAKRQIHEKYGKKYPMLMYSLYTANGKYGLHIKGETNGVINCASFVKDLLVIGQTNGVFSLYKMPNFELIHSLSITNSNITSCIMNNSADWIGFASSSSGQLFVWEWRSQVFVMKQQGHLRNINCISFSNDSNLIATGGFDGKLKLWNAKNAFCFITFHDHSAPITAIKFAQKNNVIVITASLDGTVRVYDLIRYVNFRTLRPPNKDDYQRFLNDVLVEEKENTERRSMIENKLNSGIPSQTARFISLTMDDSNEIIIAGCSDPFEIYIWSLRTAKCIDILYGHEGPISCLTFSSSTNILVSGSWDKTIRFWDLYNQASTEIINTNSEVLDIEYRFDGKEICCSTLNGQIQLYTINGKHINTINTIGCLNTISYSPNGKCLIAAGNSKYICLYYLPQSLLLRRYITTINKDLEGVTDNPNMNKKEAALNELEMERNRDIIKLNRRQLPGVDITDYSSRRRKEIISTSCIEFAGTGMMWAAATTDGLLLYSQSDIAIFDPIDLDITITPNSIKKQVKKGSYTKALMMSIKLNDVVLIKQVIESVPHRNISICIETLTPKYFENMLYILSENIESTQYLEFYLLWINKLCTIHSSYLCANWTTYLPYFRLIQKTLSSLYKDIAPICNANIDCLAFLSTFGRKNKRKRIEFDQVEDVTVAIKANGQFGAILL